MFGLRYYNLFLFAILFFLPSFTHAKTLTFEDQKWEVPAEFSEYVEQHFVRNDFNLMSLASTALLGNQDYQSTSVLDTDTVKKIAEITPIVNRQAVNPKLIIENNRAKEFVPPQNGISLDLYQLRQLLNTDLETIKLPVILSEPKTRLADTNTLGINELVGVGESDFSGSPKNRIFNINVGAGKFNGVIIAKGEEFSFNNYLGEVDGEHGFLPELVIKRTGVTPEFGGGLCQVSSTSFRAAMNSGLPITARRNHSFAVKYYAPQGTDATIYPGSSDLKFVNDTPGPILIHTKVAGNKLYFEYYGTKDNRVVAFDGPVQYDKKSDGSMKATWTRHVTINGETKTQVFNSTYLPPALFHPAPAATPTPPPEQTATPQPTTNPDSATPTQPTT